MKTKSIWIEIIALGTTSAFALALLIATLGAAAVAVGGQANGAVSAPKTYEGVVTCSRCGAKHSADLGKTAADCTRDCVHSGAAFALVDGDKTYQLEGDADLLRKAAGQRARIHGVVRGNTLKVSSVAASS
jgi:hypothetical protein